MTISDTKDIAGTQWLFNGLCEFRFGVARLENLPPDDRLEICFAGRSNVGKSSLINALTGQKLLARISNTPGRTQELNFFALAHDAAWLVDLPGYGYARAGKRKVAAWNKLLRAYLKGRAALRRAYVLIDARHGLKPNDLEMLDELDAAAVSYQIVLTKIDKLKSGALESSLENIVAATQKTLAKRPAAHPHLLATSATKNIGIEDLRAAIAHLVDFSKTGYKG